MTQNSFVGTWRLVFCEIRNAEGHVSHPYGKDDVGYIMYSQDGYMSVVIMNANRPNFDIAEETDEGSAEEKAAAYDTYNSYCGKYEIQGNKVIHHVEASMFPNWVGTAQVRFFEFMDNQLSLSTLPFLLSGESQIAGQLIWERVSTT